MRLRGLRILRSVCPFKVSLMILQPPLLRSTSMRGHYVISMVMRRVAPHERRNSFQARVKVLACHLSQCLRRHIADVCQTLNGLVPRRLGYSFYYGLCLFVQTFSNSTHRLPKHAHRLKTKLTKLSASIQQKKPTIASGPTVCTSSPLMGIHTSVARDATKYIEP